MVACETSRSCRRSAARVYQVAWSLPGYQSRLRLTELCLRSIIFVALGEQVVDHEPCAASDLDERFTIRYSEELTATGG